MIKINFIAYSRAYSLLHYTTSESDLSDNWCLLQREEAMKSAVEEFEMQVSLSLCPSLCVLSSKHLTLIYLHCNHVQGADLSGIIKHASEELNKCAALINSVHTRPCCTVPLP